MFDKMVFDPSLEYCEDTEIQFGLERTNYHRKMLFGFGFTATNIQSSMKREYLTGSFLLILNNFLVMAKKLVYSLLFFLQAYPF